MYASPLACLAGLRANEQLSLSFLFVLGSHFEYGHGRCTNPYVFVMWLIFHTFKMTDIFCIRVCIWLDSSCYKHRPTYGVSLYTYSISNLFGQYYECFRTWWVKISQPEDWPVPSIPLTAINLQPGGGNYFKRSVWAIYFWKLTKFKTTRPREIDVQANIWRIFVYMFEYV